MILNIRHELDMSKCIIVLELTLQNIIYLPWYTEIKYVVHKKRLWWCT